MIQQINPLQPDAWLQEFVKSEHYRRVCDQYDHVIKTYREMSLIKAAWHSTVYAESRAVMEEHRVLDIVPHYYIKYLLEIAPQSMLDIGCGENIFKKTYPNIVGMDSNPNANYDLFDHFDQQFVQGHVGSFDAVLTINTVHFAAVDQIKQRLLWIADLLRPGGRAFVSTNLETWLMHSSKELCQTLFPGVPQYQTILEYVHRQIVDTGLNFLVIDYPALSCSTESSIRDEYNGNIRLVFEK